MFISRPFEPKYFVFSPVSRLTGSYGKTPGPEKRCNIAET